MKKDVLIIGGGPAGMATMDKLYELGINDILLAERAERLGGLLPQCIHDGFGLTKLGTNMAGPEYASVYQTKLMPHIDDILIEATVMDIEQIQDDPDGYTSKSTIATSNGNITVDARAIVLATGCRERGRGAAYIPGTRPSGIYTAGTAQSLINLQNLMIGKRAVIVGSGDIGLIMARRLTLEGVDVKCVVEIDSVSGGLARNIRQCLHDFDIPLYFDTEVTEICGKDRVTGVKLSNGTEIECDTVILSVGLIPENSLLDHRSGIGSILSSPAITDDAAHSRFADSIFVCGNALYVHGLVDDVSASGEQVACDVAEFLRRCHDGEDDLLFSHHQFRNIDKTRSKEKERLAKRRAKLIAKKNSNTGAGTITCVLCPRSCEIDEDGNGGECPRGAIYATEERTEPKRVLTSSVMVWSDLISLRTSKPIRLSSFPEAMERIRVLRFGPDCMASFRGEPMPSRPMIRPGDVLVKDFIDGADLIATRGNIKNL